MMRILHVVSVLDVGGMESYIMNMYRRIDRSEVQFDFLVHHARRGVFEDEIEALGGHVYHTTLMDDFNLIKYIRELIPISTAFPAPLPPRAPLTRTPSAAPATATSSPTGQNRWARRSLLPDRPPPEGAPCTAGWLGTGSLWPDAPPSTPAVS